MKHRYIFLVSLVAATLLAEPAVYALVTVTTVGSPAFQVVDTHLYTAPGDVPTFQALFPHHFPTRIAHSPPYDQEFADGLVITGYPEKEVFTVADFTSPSAVHLGFVLVPGVNAPVGSSFDFGSGGPIIPNSIFPIAVRGDVYLNGDIYEQNAFGFNLPAAAGFDGASHFLADLWENSAFAPPGLGSLAGNYEYRITLRDVNNNGFNVLGQFAVPEPASLSLLITTAILGSRSFRRRQTSMAGLQSKSTGPSQS